MDEGRGPAWLTSYYERTQADSAISFRRRDNVTNWSYGIMAAAVGAYAGFFADGSLVPPLGRLGLVAGALIVLTRFFFMSAIAYGFYQRSRHFRKRIEKHWMHGTPTLDTIISEIDAYDHGRALPPTIRGVLTGQVKSGAVIAPAVPLVLLSHELHLGHSWAHWLILAALAGYFALESYNYRSYDQMQRPRNAGADAAAVRG